MIILKTFEEMGKTIRELRIKKGLTQNELAKSIKVSVSSIARWESGKIELTKASYIILLADYFGVSTDYILMQ